MLQSDGEAIALWVVEVCHKVGSMFSVLSEEVFSLLTGEIVKHIPRQHREGGRKGEEREEREEGRCESSYLPQGLQDACSHMCQVCRLATTTSPCCISFLECLSLWSLPTWAFLSRHVCHSVTRQGVSCGYMCSAGEKIH